MDSFTKSEKRHLAASDLIMRIHSPLFSLDFTVFVLLMYCDSSRDLTSVSFLRVSIFSQPSQVLRWIC
ncbi:hypothetical protein JTE90_000228 [Oedothorax gibbosus]|uniref:Uncharacterized protein n=1 Tax=Oedothorax gibbosus TaxID=931172 RepID=A0AAV6VD42_9ARAC|nr:hypothetical protein JTE90_000228 [Oedothorax gibbosus]